MAYSLPNNQFAYKYSQPQYNKLHGGNVHLCSIGHKQTTTYP